MKQPETAADMRQRHTELLTKAWAAWFDKQNPRPPGVPWVWAERDYKTVRAAVYAVVPGKQKARNIKALLDAAVKAAARVIRRAR